MSVDFAAGRRVLINGSPMPRACEPLLEELVVDNDLHLPDRFALRFSDPDGTVLQRAGLKIGVTVSVALSAVGATATSSVISGEVTSVEAQYSRQGTHAVVRGYELSYRLQTTRTTKAWNNVTDSDIARSIAQKHGLSVGRIDSSSTVHEHLPQLNVTDWDFLEARAREIGYDLRVSEARLHFCAAAAADPPTLELTVGENLEQFHPRVSSASQVSGVRVRGWDPSTKKTVVGSRPPAAGSASLFLTPHTLAGRAHASVRVAADRPLSSQTETDAAAGALAERLGGSFLEADGTARGDPRLCAGVCVKVARVASEFEGRFVLTSARHVWDGIDGYKTQFTVSGRQERSLLGLAGGGESRGAGVGPRVSGVVVGQVSNVKDPKSLGRAKLKFPWLSDDYESGWVRVCQSGAGNGYGAVFLPEVGDEVLVAFEHGDVRQPYVIGGLYNGVDRPNLGDGLVDETSGSVKRRGIISRNGHKLVFLDDGAKSGVALITARNLRIALKDTGTTIHIATTDGAVLVEGKNVTVSATESLRLACDGTLAIEGGTVSLKAKETATVDGGPMLTVKGDVVRIN